MKMKFTHLLAALLLGMASVAQIPTNYYSTATGTGFTLKTQLHRIINTENDGLPVEYFHTDQGYDAMDGFIANYDLDMYYEVNSNTILDPYSENPAGSDPYTFSPVTDECGNYNSEGDCYNKEHVIPQSVFNQATPMRSDAHELLPTDGRVNGFRGSYPFGVVDDSNLINQSGISNPTQNGSKLGANINSGYAAGYSGIVFEPIDEFKGDIARIHFYFATRYQDLVANWGNYAMFNGTSDVVFDETFLNILLEWHQMDPVSQKEIDRNNNIFYHHQSNRNPFIDNPEYVNLIWNSEPDTEAPSTPTNLIASNPTNFTIDLNWTAATDNVGVTFYDIYQDGVNRFTTANTNFTVTGLTPSTTYCFTVVATDAAGNTSGFSNEACETTTNTDAGNNCLTETFQNIPANSGSYDTRTWTGDNGGTWTATDARTDQTISNRAITVRNGSITAPSTSGGIGSFTVTTKRVFGGSPGTFNLKVNNTLVGTIAYGDQDVVQTTTISNINIEGTVSITIDGNTGSNRVAFDDLSYTCYANLSTAELNKLEANVYPNPVKNLLHITLSKPEETQVEIYNVLGKNMLQKTIQATGTINTQSLSSGMYILRITQGNQTISKKLIKH
ncbi:endonuclease [Bizionia sediminis]|uniref:Endonuclease n=1 Tax=Bizionia sediminis TaxID=1737064 RepID=A0ABW5KPD5_9FLAO